MNLFETLTGSVYAVITSLLLVLVGLAIGKRLPRTDGMHVEKSKEDAFREELEQKLGSPLRKRACSDEYAEVSQSRLVEPKPKSRPRGRSAVLQSSSSSSILMTDQTPHESSEMLEPITSPMPNTGVVDLNWRM